MSAMSASPRKPSWPCWTRVSNQDEALVPIDIPTVFVVGAGASVPYGLPTGQTLVERLKRNHHPLEYALRYTGPHSEQQVPVVAKDFSETLRKSGALSIDRFLEDREDYAKLGKLAIAADIYPREQLAPLHEKTKTHWVATLFHKIRCKPKILSRSNNIKFIIFNYDRIVEIYLMQMLRHSYKISEKEAEEIITSFDMIHPYGSLDAPLCFGDVSHTNGNIHNDHSNGKRAALAAKTIEVMNSERIGDEVTSRFNKTAEWLSSWAEQVFFLGFGFDIENCKRLGLQSRDWLEGDRRTCVATMYETRNKQMLNFCSASGHQLRDVSTPLRATGLSNPEHSLIIGTPAEDCSIMIEDWLSIDSSSE